MNREKFKKPAEGMTNCDKCSEEGQWDALTDAHRGAGERLRRAGRGGRH